MNLSRRALQTNVKLFSNFKFLLDLAIGQKTKKYSKQIATIYQVQCVIYQWIHLDKLYKLVESFSQVSCSFLNY